MSAADLEAHRPPEAAPAQLHLDRGQQVVGLVLLEHEVGVARHPERVVLADHHVGEQRRQLGGDDLLERHEPLAVGHHHETGQQRRDLHPRHPLDAVHGVAHPDDEVQREVGDVGERMSGVDRQRRQHREDLPVEGLGQVLAVGVVERGPVRHPHSRLGQGGHDRVEEDAATGGRRARSPGRRWPAGPRSAAGRRRNGSAGPRRPGP